MMYIVTSIMFVVNACSSYGQIRCFLVDSLISRLTYDSRIFGLFLVSFGKSIVLVEDTCAVFLPSHSPLATS